MKSQEVIQFLFLLLIFNYADKTFGEEYLGHIRTQTNPEIQKEAVEGLIQRTIKNIKNDTFIIHIDPNFTINDKEAFEVATLQNGSIAILATTGVVAATGFNFYLKYYLKVQIAWQTSQLYIPKELPLVAVRKPMNDRFRYYQNVCTVSYSFVWWDWSQWEKHIDWMALNSYNLVLSFHGQEAIWKRVYKKLNLTDDDIHDQETGPAFLAWLRMGNMRGWGGPLSDAWHDRSLNLQKRILTRMREFGMIPVLPAFEGHVPRAMKRIYPYVNMTKMAPWNHFSDQYCCPYFLDPTEDLFNVIGTMYMQEQIAEFGTDHIYNCDSFNENEPTSGNLTYLRDVGKSIFKAMTDVDPQAVWMVQNWLFVNNPIFWNKSRAEAFLTSVPLGRMLVLDLMAEQEPKYKEFDQYFGQPFIWCMLHNFGGTLGLHGIVNSVNENIAPAREAVNSTMVGTGITPEGINQNYIIYDLMSDMAWIGGSVNLSEWFTEYTIRRYGQYNYHAAYAWELLKGTVYNYDGRFGRLHGHYIIVDKPTLRLYPRVWYNCSTVMEAWDHLLNASEALKENEGYQYDLVDVTRQILQLHGAEYYLRMIKAYRKKTYDLFMENSYILLNVLLDLEDITATNEHFLLGNWLESAKASANNSEDEEQFEFNARNQITLWGPNGEIDDYAIKQWSGIIRSFAYPRWLVFINYLNFTFNGNFSQSAINELIFETVEKPFTCSRSLYPTQPLGSTVKIAKQIRNRWWIVQNWTMIESKLRQRRKGKKTPQGSIEISRTSPQLINTTVSDYCSQYKSNFISNFLK